MFENSRWAVGLTKEKIDTIRQFYFDDRCEDFLARMANFMRQSHYIVMMDDGRIYPVSYVGDLAIFMMASISELIGQANLSPVRTAWFSENLPTSVSPKIEIGPSKVLNYIWKAIKVCPNNALGEFEEKFNLMASKLDAIADTN